VNRRVDRQRVAALRPIGTADFSDCGLYRYRLTRQLGLDTRIANFIQLNPSKADAEKNDPTIRRDIGFAVAWGYGELFVENLFGFRATEPDDMLGAAEPVGPKNDDYIIGAACRAHESGGVVVAAWGIHGGHQDRDRPVMSLLVQTLGIPVMCLGITADGFPRHPLYLPKAAALVPYPAGH
jgi:hypothetical protein